jgi:hypothetical protein
MRWPLRIAAAALGLSGPAALAQTSVGAAAVASPVLPASVESSELKSFDPWEVGAASRADGALPSTLWKNSDAVAVGALFDKLQAPFASPAANRLARAALLSSGSAPAGSEAAAREAVRKRFAALGRFGAAEEIAQMVSASPAAAADPNINMFAAQAELARGRNADACRRGQAASNVTPFFLRLRAFCAAAAGDAAASDLALDVARNANAADPWLSAALPALANGGKGAPGAKFDNSLDAAISVAGKLKPAAKPLAGSSLLAMGAVARADTAPALRVEAALETLRIAAIGANEAEAAFAAGAGLKSTKRAPVPPIVNAVRIVRAADGAPARALALEAALNSMLTFPDYWAAARLFKDDIAQLPKDASTAAAAPALARAALAVGDAKGAAEWRNLVVQSPQPPPETIRSALDAALVAAGQGNSETAKVVVERRINLASGLSLRRASRDVILLGALGVPAPPPAAGFINANPPPPPLAKADAAALANAAAASQRGAAGETAIYVAMALAPGANRVELDSVVTAIQVLRAVGLMDLARIVAVEAMIADGVS